MRQLSHARRSRLCDADIRNLYRCRLARSARALGTARAGLVSRTRKATPGTWGRFSPAFGITWKVHSRQGASCAPRRDIDTCPFVPGGSRRRAVPCAAIPHGLAARRRTSSPRSGQLRIDMLYRSTKSHTTAASLQGALSAPARHVDMSTPGRNPGEGKGLRC